MNAEDLVITLKKNMAKLSKSERRRAIESVRDIIRAAMFDDAAGSGYAMERYDCVCVENLDMRGMSRSLKLGKSTMDNGFGMFRALLGYKLEDRGKRLVTVGRLFPSSQLCHECGYRFSGTKDLSVREWTCPLCGRTHDRDVNAARNIRDEGMRLALSA